MVDIPHRIRSGTRPQSVPHLDEVLHGDCIRLACFFCHGHDCTAVENSERFALAATRKNGIVNFEPELFCECLTNNGFECRRVLQEFIGRIAKSREFFKRQFHLSELGFACGDLVRFAFPVGLNTAPTRAVCTTVFVNGIDFHSVCVGADRNLFDLACENTRFIGSLQEFGHKVLLNKETAVRGSGFVKTACRSRGESLVHLTARHCRSICCHELFTERRESLFIVLGGSGFYFGFFARTIFGFDSEKFFRSADTLIPRADFLFVFVDVLLLFFGEETVFCFRLIKYRHRLESCVLSLCFHFENFLHIHLFSSD